MIPRVRMARKRLMVAREREAKMAPLALRTDIGDERWTIWDWKHKRRHSALRAIELRKDAIK